MFAMIADSKLRDFENSFASYESLVVYVMKFWNLYSQPSNREVTQSYLKQTCSSIIKRASSSFCFLIKL